MRTTPTPLFPAAAGFLLLALTACSDATPPPAKTEPTPAEPSIQADTVYTNGKIITVNDEQPEAQAVAVTDGLITYVGDQQGAQALIGDNTREVDLQGRTLVPGFVDAHGHVISAGLQAASANLLPAPDGAVNSFAQLVDVFSTWATSEDGKEFIENTGWLVGFGFDDSQLQEQQL